MTTENLNMEAMHQMADIYARLGQSNPDFIVSENESMMRINENLLKNTAARVEKNQYFDPFIYPLAKPIISGETYTFSYEGGGWGWRRSHTHFNLQFGGRLN